MHFEVAKTGNFIMVYKFEMHFLNYSLSSLHFGFFIPDGENQKNEQ